MVVVVFIWFSWSFSSNNLHSIDRVHHFNQTFSRIRIEWTAVMVYSRTVKDLKSIKPHVRVLYLNQTPSLSFIITKTPSSFMTGDKFDSWSLNSHAQVHRFIPGIWPRVRNLRLVRVLCSETHHLEGLRKVYCNTNQVYPISTIYSSHHTPT